MNTEKIQRLIDKFYEGRTTLEEKQQLMNYFQREEIPDELQSEAAYFQYLMATHEKNISADFDPFAKMEADSIEPVPSIHTHTPGAPTTTRGNHALWWSLRIAAGFILLLIGFAAGQVFDEEGDASTEQVAELRQEVQQMKEALMYGGTFRQASAGERLSAVKMTSQFETGSNRLDQQISDILIYTMNNDKSVNVRLAAAEALFQFRNEAQIQKALVNALPQQEDPQMQLALIEILVQLKAKGALNEMNKLLMDSDTREVVRERLQAGIAELKT